MKNILVATDTWSLYDHPALVVPAQPEYLRLLLQLMDEARALYEKYGRETPIDLRFVDHNAVLCSGLIAELDWAREWLCDDENTQSHIVVDEEIPDECLVDTDDAVATASMHGVWWTFYFDMDTFIESELLERLYIEELLKEVER